MLYSIKVNSILCFILEHLKINVKLKLIKYNKKLLDKLKINIEYFKQNNYLKNFNDKFHLNIKDINVKILSLNDKAFGNKILYKNDYYNAFKFEILIISGNEISDIKELENFKSDNLEILNMSNNDIVDIRSLEKLKFKKLKLLDLKENII